MSLRSVPFLLMAPVLLGAWTEPPRSLRPQPIACDAPRVIDGDSLECRDGPRVRLRGVDTAERGQPGYAEARAELQRRLAGRQVVVVPRHRSWGRLVADVLADGEDVGRAMDRDGWSKAEGARR